MNIWQVVLVVLGNAGFFALIQTLVQRHDRKKGLLAEIKSDVQELKRQGIVQERDNCRTQLLLLISDYPEEKQEIMTLAKHYFVDLEGNWYASSIYRKYLHDHQIEAPFWFLNHVHK